LEAQNAHELPPVASCIATHALHWAAGSFAELPVHIVLSGACTIADDAAGALAA
jgi:hypothetical protein